MFKDYDCVELTEDIDATLCAGTLGTILMIYPGNPPEYEVEFMDKEESLGYYTVTESLLRIVIPSP